MMDRRKTEEETIERDKWRQKIAIEWGFVNKIYTYNNNNNNNNNNN